MTKVIYKYSVAGPGGTSQHSLPVNAEFVHVGIQPHEAFPVQAWYLLDPFANEHWHMRTLMLVATGQNFEGDYLGTIVDNPTHTVWHLIETRE